MFRSIAATQTMSAAEFLSWSAEQDGRFELIGGQALRMMIERAAHAHVKTRLARELFRQIPEGGSCAVYLDGMAVRVSEADVYEPDLLIRCEGAALEDDATFIEDPRIVFEILSPSTTTYDMLVKVPRYLALPSVTHVVLLDVKRRSALVYDKETSTGSPRILPGDASITLPLSGGALTLALEAVFSPPGN